jgi:O-antigen/teichoic acid export membrane protein
LTYRRILLFLFLAAFAEEEVAALRWLLALVTEVGAEPALQGLGYSALSLAANAALIYGVVWLGHRWWRTRRRPHLSIRRQADPVQSEEGESNERHHECT